MAKCGREATGLVKYAGERPERLDPRVGVVASFQDQITSSKAAGWHCTSHITDNQHSQRGRSHGINGHRTEQARPCGVRLGRTVCLRPRNRHLRLRFGHSAHTGLGNSICSERRPAVQALRVQRGNFRSRFAVQADLVGGQGDVWAGVCGGGLDSSGPAK